METDAVNYFSTFEIQKKYCIFILLEELEIQNYVL